MSVVKHICGSGSNLLKELFLVKHMSSLKMLGLFRTLIELVERIVHSAVLDTKDGLMGFFRPAGSSVVGPVSDSGSKGKRRLISCKLVGRNNTVQYLMHRVPGNPGLRDYIGLSLFNVVELKLNIV